MKTVEVPRRLDFVPTKALIEELGRRHTCGVVMLVKPSKTNPSLELSVHVISPEMGDESSTIDRMVVAAHVASRGTAELVGHAAELLEEDDDE